MAERRKLKFYLIIFLVGFAVNFIWEINQMPYFVGKPGSIYAEGIFYCGLASIIDGLTVILIYFLANKILKLNSLKSYLQIAIFAAFCSIIFENIAFYFNLWSYKENMPRVPLVGIGILPFVQLITLVPLSIFLTQKIFGESEKIIDSY